MGLRERKKAKTARAIETAALARFSERGFQATTIAEIAATADVAPRTFFSYFPSKRSVLFGDFDDMFAGLQKRLKERGDASFLDPVRAWVVEFTDVPELDQEREQTRRRVIDTSDALLAFERHQFTRLEDLIAGALADELGQEPTGLHPRLIAAATAATLGVLRRETQSTRGEANDPLAPVDDVLAFLHGGMNALQNR